MTRRARHFFTNPNGSLSPYTMRDIWNLNDTVVVAGTTYQIRDTGWKKIK